MTYTIKTNGQVTITTENIGYESLTRRAVAELPKDDSLAKMQLAILAKLRTAQLARVEA